MLFNHISEDLLPLFITHSGGIWLRPQAKCLHCGLKLSPLFVYEILDCSEIIRHTVSNTNQVHLNLFLLTASQTYAVSGSTCFSCAFIVLVIVCVDLVLLCDTYSCSQVCRSVETHVGYVHEYCKVGCLRHACLLELWAGLISSLNLTMQQCQALIPK